MKARNLFILKAALTMAAVLVLSPLRAETMSLEEAAYKAGKARISADYRAGRALCASLAVSAKDLCDQRAKAMKNIARADLKQGHGIRPGDPNKVLEARASAY